MERRIREQLKQLKTEYGRINPDRAWVVSNREKTMRQIINTTSSETTFDFHFIYNVCKALVPKQIYPVVRPIVAIGLVIAVAASGWIASASASAGCLPGDVCYGVKIAAEKTQAAVVAVTGTKKDKAKLHLEFASRRAKEVKKVVETKKTEAPKQAAVAIQKLEESIKTVNDTIKEVKEEKPSDIVEVKNEVEKTTSEIKQTLKEAGAQNANVDVTEAKKVVKDANLNAVAAVVETKEAGKINMSDKDAKTMVEKAINDTMTENNVVKDSAVSTTELVKQIEAKPIAVTSTPAQTDATSTNTAVVTSSLLMVTSTPKKPIIVQPSNGSTSTTSNVPSTVLVKTVVEDATKQTEATQKNLEAAQELVNNNQLLQAIEKVKSTTETSVKTEQTVQEVQKAVEVVATTVTTTAIIKK